LFAIVNNVDEYDESDVDDISRGYLSFCFHLDHEPTSPSQLHVRFDNECVLIPELNFTFAMTSLKLDDVSVFLVDRLQMYALQVDIDPKLTKKIWAPQSIHPASSSLYQDRANHLSPSSSSPTLTTHSESDILLQRLTILTTQQFQSAWTDGILLVRK
jgi:hypothetical protein